MATDPAVPAWTAALLDGGGNPSRCGTNCGNVLVAGGLGVSLGASTGAAQLFELLRLTGLSDPKGLACGGERLTIEGRGLGDVAAVNFGSVAVSDLAVNDRGTQITVTTPRHPPVAVPVTVTTKSGASTPVNPDITYTFEPVAPATIGGLSPAQGRAGGGTKVDITGTFAPSCVRAVRFGGQTADFAIDPDKPGTKITATSPEGTPGQQVRVSVAVDPGPPAPADSGIPSVASQPGDDLFTYLALPAISAISPPRGPAFGGQTVALTGTGFEGATEVRFGGVPATAVTVQSPTRLTATVPAHDPGPVPVTVSTPKRGASEVSGASHFTYHPGISGLFPPSGPLTGGTEVTIAGRGFAGAKAVRFGTASVVPISLTDTEIVVKTPPHGLPEAVPVQLTAAGLNSLPENVMFNYGLADVVDPDPVTDPGSGPPKHNTTTVEPAPPGGSPAVSPSSAASPSASPTPGVAPAPGAVPTPGQAPVPGQAPLSAQVPGQSASPSNSPGALPPPIPVASPVAAPGTAMGQGGPGANHGVAGAGEDDEGQGAHRYAMSDARTTLALGAAGATGCFTFLAAARREPARRRRRSGAGRPQPKGAY